MARPSSSHSGNTGLVSIGKSVRAIRKIKKISQEDLALIAGLDRSYVGGVERGEHNLTVITLCKLAEALEVSPAKLMANVK